MAIAGRLPIGYEPARAAHGDDRVVARLVAGPPLLRAADRNKKALEVAFERELRSYEAHQAQVHNKADVELRTLDEARQRPARPGSPS
jgi:hypothetical protein